MHRIILLLSILSFIVGGLKSQNFTGKITDNDNSPIFGSAVLIKETNQGLACNDDGEFQITLPNGKYHVEYRCLGYEPHLQVVVIVNKVNVHVILLPKVILLKEVEVYQKEDPAYAIMRNAIKKAPYYQNVVKEYQAETYIKGNMELVKVNKLVDKMSSVNGLKMSDFKEKLFVQESYSDIKFNAPDKYEQTVKAFSSSIPDNFDSKDVLALSRGSIYNSRFVGLISPLHPKSFTYYRFRYEGYTEEKGDVVNKIKVIPKVKDPELVEGYIYIADNSWDIRNAELTSKMYGLEQNFAISYGSLSNIDIEIFMPISYSNKMSGNILGVEAYMNYYASIKYNSFVLNDSIINNIEKKKEKKSLEIKRDDKYLIKTDSLASERSSLYWDDIRNIPLNEKEEFSYEIKDSVQTRIDSLRKDHSNAKFKPTDLLSGGKLGGDSTKYAFKYGGLLGSLLDYNFVDGFGLGQKFELSAKIKNNHILTLAPEIYYTTARKNLIWKTDVNIQYAPMRLGKLSFSIGDISSDFNSVGANRLDNAISSLFWGKNVSMFYRDKYMRIRNDIDITHGLQLTTQVKAADRSPLQNNIYYSFFGAKRKAKHNIESPLHADLLSYTLGLRYTPRLYYSIRNGKKTYEYTNHPSFYVAYSEGFSSWKSNQSRFRKLEGQIVQSLKIDLFSKLQYRINGGAFLGEKNKMNFADFKHFDTTDDLWLVTKSPFTSFMLLNAYEASTNDYWFSTQLSYNSKYILLKRLHFLQGKMFNESVHLKYLFTPNKKNYMEAGYSVDLFRAFSFGVYTSLHKFKYDGFGVRLALDFNFIK